LSRKDGAIATRRCFPKQPFCIILKIVRQKKTKKDQQGFAERGKLTLFEKCYAEIINL
jgi:hypothetical protein